MSMYVFLPLIRRTKTEELLVIPRRPFNVLINTGIIVCYTLTRVVKPLNIPNANNIRTYHVEC